MSEGQISASPKTNQRKGKRKAEGERGSAKRYKTQSKKKWQQRDTWARAC